jgi:hypothetical protein
MYKDKQRYAEYEKAACLEQITSGQGRQLFKISCPAFKLKYQSACTSM